MHWPPRQALVLVGGEGTRLRPLTYRSPKALLPLLGRPLVSYGLRWLARAGVRQAVLAVAHAADRLRQGLGDRACGLELTYVQELRPLGTAGALKNAQPVLPETFWVLNGDLVFDFDPAPLLAQHRRLDAELTLTLRSVADVSAFGLVQCDAQSRVQAFREKVAGDAGGCDTVNAGIYLMRRSVLDRIPAGQVCSSERELFPGLVAEGARVCGYLPPDMPYWNDLGRVETYLQANRDLLAGALPGVGPARAPSAVVEPGARVQEPGWIGEEVRLAAGACVGPNVTLEAGVVVGEGAVVADSLVHPGAVLGSGAHLRSVVVAAGESVSPGYCQEGGIIYRER